MTTDIAIHIALALLFSVIAGAIGWGVRAAGLDPLPTTAALAGVAFFLAWELGQGLIKARAGGTMWSRANWPEAYWPAVACAVVAAIVTVVLKWA